MKVKLLALAVTAAIAMPGLALADGPTVYGKLNLSLENVDYDFGYDPSDFGYAGSESSADNWQVISNASRFGVKGDAKINNMLKATYLIEWGVDGADNTTLSNRNRSVGLAGNFGALDIGHFDTPLKVAQGKVDQFNDLSGDLQYVLLGDNRATNIVQYTSPDMSGLQAKLAIMPGEQYDNGVNEDPKDGLADAISSSVAFTSGPIYAALAYDKDVSSTVYISDFGGLGTVNAAGTALTNPYALATGSDYFDTLRLVGQYAVGPVSVGAIYQQAELSDSDPGEQYDQDGFLLSGAFTIGQTVLKAQYTTSTGDDGEDELDSAAIGLGVDQKLSAQTTVFGYYNMLSYEWDFDGAEEQEKNNLGVGIVHSF